MKTVYIWGTVSTFTAPLIAFLLAKGWHVHIACKSAINILSLSPLDLPASARDALQIVLGGRNQFKAFQDKIKFLENGEVCHDTVYDAFVFYGLPPNFDDARVPRALWAASELPAAAKAMRGVPVFIVSSLWGGIQPDGVVPEELEFERRKPRHHWERVCQNYEERLIQGLSKIESNWYFIRLPLLTPSTADGYSFSFTGLAHLFTALDPQFQSAHNGTKSSAHEVSAGRSVSLAHAPDSTLWFLPVDTAVYLFWRLLEDGARPRICNLVSTQATLNREWLQYLAQAEGLKEIVPAQHKDGLVLPMVLRKLLRDNVQVKTRNLFEVTGRYQLRPEKLDQNYFAKVIDVGRRNNWGLRKIHTTSSLPFTRELGNYYFEQFMPSHIGNGLLHKLLASDASVGFRLKDSASSGWILKTEKIDNVHGSKSKLLVRHLSDSDKPKICFHLTGDTMSSLVRNELTLHRALLMKKIEVEGPLLDVLRISEVLSHFMKENPLKEFPFAVKAI